MKTSNLMLAVTVTVFCFSGCKLDKPDFSKISTNINSTTNTSGGTSPVNVTAEYYLKGTLNGKALTWQVDPSSVYATGTSSALSMDKGNITGELTATISEFNNSKPLFGVEFRNIQVNTSEDITAYFNSFINTGTWPFATSLSDLTSMAKSLVIDYTDDKGNAYSSVGPQTGNNATVVSVTQIPKQLGTAESLKIKLTFSCQLYPVDGIGSSLTLSNAEATVHLEDLIH